MFLVEGFFSFHILRRFGTLQGVILLASVKPQTKFLCCSLHLSFPIICVLMSFMLFLLARMKSILKELPKTCMLLVYCEKKVVVIAKFATVLISRILIH